MRTVEAEELLASTGWVRRLAGHLVREGDADDLAQETWVAAIEGRRPAGVALPAWLGGIVRNLRRMGARTDGRRRAREQAAATDPALAPAADAPEAALERVELDQLLGRLVLALDEPYRSTIALRYYEGLTASEIARRTGVPAGTVRWRLKEGIDRLRRALDDRWGRREAWLPVLAPFAVPARKIRPAHPLPSKLVIPAVLALGGAAFWMARPPARVPHHESPPAPVARQELPSAPRPVAPRSNAPARLTAASASTTARDVIRIAVPLGAAPVAGPADAKVTILLLGEYECVFCARAHATLQQLQANHPRDVRVQLVQTFLPMHQRALPAARAVYAAAEQGKYFEMDQLLFAKPDAVVRGPAVESLLASSEGVVRDTGGVMRRPALEDADLERHARGLGLDLERFHADLAGPAVELRLAIDQATVESAGTITAVPVTFVNGRRLNGSRSLEVLEKMVAEELQAADELLAKGAAPASLYNELLASPVAEPKLVRLNPGQLDALTGVYQAESGPKLIVRREGERLALVGPGGAALELWPISESALVVKGSPPARVSAPARVTMARTNGRVTGLELQHTDGTTASAKRLSDYPPPLLAARIPVPAPRSAAASSDGFESGTLAAWRTDVTGVGGWFAYSSGQRAPEPRLSDPRAPFAVPEPPQGRFAAISDTKAPGTRILYRDVALDGRYRLRMTVYYVCAGDLTAPGTLEAELPEPNQQYRIELLSLSAPIDAVGAPHVLAKIFATAAGGPRRLEPTPLTFDLSPWQGQTVRLRLVAVDNRTPLRAGADDIRFEKLEEP